MGEESASFPYVGLRVKAHQVPLFKSAMLAAYTTFWPAV
jgi:hypothetical protein